MENAQKQFDVKELLSNPNNLMEAFRNPSKFGLDIYRSLSTRNKQYLAFAGAAGLIAYGVILGRQK
ncbi:hypothetical protein HUW51_21670 [Adhaeribacter swui]|uniref:Uncharacterized protein n=1 Tax=Adhaeribacter swui TaxID=2086471 RepID=A0A7G7GDG3_9BACT|nr:hypothetical protein [Adhaeribacter swui]QNF35197.1 hypothetical protein HUW51_21670 [Adhaeribacter swui]